MASLADNFGSAIRSLVEQRSRTILSALGILVGAVAILLLVGIAKGVQKDISREIDDLGVNLLIVLPGRIDEATMMAPGLFGISYIQDQDIDRVRKVGGVERAVPITFVGSGATYTPSGSQTPNTSPTTLILATEPGWFKMHRLTMAEGRVFDEAEADEPVAVVGALAARSLFDGQPGVGRFIDYNGRSYRVVGVTESREQRQSLFQQGSFENVIYIPYRHMRSVQPGMQIDRIMVQTAPDREPRELIESVESVLAQRLDREVFSVLTQEDLLNLVFRVMSILTWLLVGLTSIALFVGGVGIMAVMMMSVNERAKEIGIRKTVGARASDVFVQFLFEAVALGLVGGLAGLGVSAGVVWALERFTPIKPLLDGSVVVLGVGTCIVVGAVFGLVPALRAARRDPVVSLRSE